MASKTLNFSGTRGSYPWSEFPGVYAAFGPWEAVPIKIWHAKMAFRISTDPNLPAMFSSPLLGIAGSVNSDGTTAKDDPLIGYEFKEAQPGTYWLTQVMEQYFRPGSEVIFPASTQSPPPADPTLTPEGDPHLETPHIDIHNEGLSASDAAALPFAGSVTVHYDLMPVP